MDQTAPPRSRRAVSRNDRRPKEQAPPTKGLAAPLIYLLVEFARPMAWLPVIGLARPGLIAAGWGFSAALVSRRRPIPRPVWYMLGLAAVMAINVPLAINNRMAWVGFYSFAIQILGYVWPIAVLPATLASARFLISAYFFFHVPTAIHGLIHQGKGLDGWMGDENDLALALNAALGVGIFLFMETSSGVKKLFIAVSCGMFLAAIAASISRGGFIGLASLALYLVIAGPYRKQVVAGIIAGALVLMLFAPAAYWEEVASIKTAAEPGDTGDTRLWFWGIAWRMYLDNPLIGVGTNNYGRNSVDYVPEDRDDLRRGHAWGRVAHSLFFTIIAEQGTVGTLLFVAILAWCFRTCLSLRRRWGEDPDSRSAALLSSGLAAGIFAVLTTGVFLSIAYYPLFWVLVGLLAAVDGTRRSDLARMSSQEE